MNELFTRNASIIIKNELNMKRECKREERAKLSWGAIGENWWVFNLNWPLSQEQKISVARRPHKRGVEFPFPHTQRRGNFHKTEKQQRKISLHKYHDLARHLLFYVPAIPNSVWESVAHWLMDWRMRQLKTVDDHEMEKTNSQCSEQSIKICSRNLPETLVKRITMIHDFQLFK